MNQQIFFLFFFLSSVCSVCKAYRAADWSIVDCILSNVKLDFEVIKNYYAGIYLYHECDGSNCCLNFFKEINNCDGSPGDIDRIINNNNKITEFCKWQYSDPYFGEKYVKKHCEEYPSVCNLKKYGKVY
jgi:hypothetical protein